MSRHLHLFSNYDSMRLADFTSPIGAGPKRLDESPTGVLSEAAGRVFSTLLDMSWIDDYPATQQRFSRIRKETTTAFQI
jgi:hypothetical protein